MLNKNDFALEQLETRLETLWIYVPYIGTCSNKVLWCVTYPISTFRKYEKGGYLGLKCVCPHGH